MYRRDGKKGNYKKIATRKGQTTVSYTDKKVSKGITYYYKVVAYKTVSKKRIYGKQSTSAYITKK